MKIVMKKLSQITPYEQNPRVNDDAVAAVAASIRQFGFRQPIVVDGQGVIIVGHTRFKAAQRLGLDKVPVVVAADLTPDQIRAYRIADNKTGELADWDIDLLADELTELNEADFDTSLLGFAEDALARLLEPPVAPDGAAPKAADIAAGAGRRGRGRAATPRDEAANRPCPPPEPTTRPGDVWLLGEHRLRCGDARRPEDFAAIFDGPPAHLIERDPLRCDIIISHWEQRSGRKAERLEVTP